MEGETPEDIAKRMQIPVSQVNKEQAPAELIHGLEISNLTDSDWDRILSKKQLVFARTSPQQKLIIVEQCQKVKLYIIQTN